MCCKIMVSVFLVIAVCFVGSSIFAAQDSPTVIGRNSGVKQVNVEFSTAMDTASVTESFTVILSLPGIGYGIVAGKAELNEDGTKAVFSPSSPLIANLDYKITITGAKDTAGNSLQFDGWSFAGDDNLPVIPMNAAETECIYTALTCAQLNSITGGNKEGMIIDIGDTGLWGKIYISQYPFEAGESDYDYAYPIDIFGNIREGKGVIPVAKLYAAKYDANDWADGVSAVTHTAEYRLDLFKENNFLGMYGSYVSFEKNGEGVFRKLPTIIDGPFVAMISSDDPSSMEIVWETDEPCSGKISIGSAAYTEEGDNLRHSVKITGLTPNTEYEYKVLSGAPDGRKVVSKTYKFRTAPVKGQGDVIFAFGSDSRSGAGGGGEWNYMGCNHYILKQIVADACRKDVDFFLFGGDMMMGMTTSKEDFILQMKGWKQGMAPFWRSGPVYGGMGNHEFTYRMFGEYEAFDRWPYETESGEALFASNVYNPENGPETSDSRRPAYRENVYSFQYGPVKVISFNNTYWFTGWDPALPSVYGGCPTGYIMEDQLKWIEDEMAGAENDPTVKYVFLFAHSPVFPHMKHVGASMWYNGNNNVRAYTKNRESGELEPEALGIVEVRNRLWKAIAGSPKAVAVFTGDEHAYHRTLITSETPVGLYPDDDTDGDGILDKYSPNPEFTHPVWQITCGGGGAPYTALRQSAPWTPEILTSHYGYVLVRADENKAAIEFIGSRSGKVMDKVEFTASGK
ncbi:MAG: hypothetical protein GY749_20685 [Desulfobacteraceae bacterium]|nr:hypothetical protein [Desulfobacteraceae bacterium]